MTEASDPTLRPQSLPDDNDRALRPQALEEFIGQAEARANLRVASGEAALISNAVPCTPMLRDIPISVIRSPWCSGWRGVGGAMIRVG